MFTGLLQAHCTLSSLPRHRGRHSEGITATSTSRALFHCGVCGDNQPVTIATRGTILTYITGIRPLCQCRALPATCEQPIRRYRHHFAAIAPIQSTGRKGKLPLTIEYIAGESRHRAPVEQNSAPAQRVINLLAFHLRTMIPPGCRIVSMQRVTRTSNRSPAFLSCVSGESSLFFFTLRPARTNR